MQHTFLAIKAKDLFLHNVINLAKKSAWSQPLMMRKIPLLTVLRTQRDKIGRTEDGDPHISMLHGHKEASKHQ